MIKMKVEENVPNVNTVNFQNIFKNIFKEIKYFCIFLRENDIFRHHDQNKSCQNVSNVNTGIFEQYF